MVLFSGPVKTARPERMEIRRCLYRSLSPCVLWFCIRADVDENGQQNDDKIHNTNHQMLFLGPESLDGEKSEELKRTERRPHLGSSRRWLLQQGDDNGGDVDNDDNGDDLKTFQDDLYLADYSQLDDLPLRGNFVFYSPQVATAIYSIILPLFNLNPKNLSRFWWLRLLVVSKSLPSSCAPPSLVMFIKIFDLFIKNIILKSHHHHHVQV